MDFRLQLFDPKAFGFEHREQAVGSDDPLMLMESMPAGQTRVYVENVMASYWIYRRMFGEGGRAQDPLPGSIATADLALASSVVDQKFAK